MSVTSEEVNYLIYRYLIENGFNHSAFAFSNESFVSRSNITGTQVPTGALILYLQKGLEYTEIDTHVNDDGTEIECQQPFSLTMPHQCEGKTKKDKDIFRRERREKKDRELRIIEKEIRLQQQQNGKEAKRLKTEILVSDTTLLPNTSILPPATPTRHETPSGDVIVDDHIIPMQQSTAPEMTFRPSDIHTYTGHTADVNICAWHPKDPQLLASGAADGTVRLWHGTSQHKTLACFDVSDNPPTSKDVTSIDWNVEGTLLAAGAYDGVLRVFDLNGSLRHSLRHHRGPVFVTRWHTNGNLLLSGSVDKSMIAWDMQTGQMKQIFDFHQGPVLNLDWRPNSNIFASCGTDHMIYVSAIDKTTPLKSFMGHKDEVNGIKWDPTGRFVASCSDDGTAKLWSMESDNCLFDMNHAREAYSLHWHPREPSFATACFDNNVYLWSSQTGQCIVQLSKHSKPVYALSFSPDGQYLASGAFDQSIHIWSLKEQKVVKSFHDQHGILDIAWSPNGQSLAATLGDKVSFEFEWKKMDVWSL